MNKREKSQKRMLINSDEVPFLIGPKGDIVSQMKRESGANIRFIEENGQSYAQLYGTNDQCESAIELIEQRRRQFNYKKKSTNKFENLAQDYQQVIQLPHGGGRYLQSTNKQFCDEFLQQFDVNSQINQKNQLILIARQEYQLNQAAEYINKMFSDFACVAVPVASWAVGRIIGKQGEGINKLCQYTKQLYNKQVLVYFPDTQLKDGINCYAIVSSESSQAVSYVIQQIQSRLSSITEQAGVITDLLPSTQYSLKQLSESCLHGQMFLQKLQQQQLKHQQEEQPLIMPLIMCPSNSIYTESSVFDILNKQEVKLKDVNFDYVQNFALNQNLCQKQAVDRRFLVLNTHFFDLENEEFWKTTIQMCLSLLQNQFFGGNSLPSDLKFELQAYPGRAVFVKKDNEVSQSDDRVELLNQLMSRDISSRFITGISEDDYLSYFLSGQEKYVWRLNLCARGSLWHHVVCDKTIVIQQKPMEFTFGQPKIEDELERIRNSTNSGEMTINSRGIAISLICHFVDYSNCRYDVMILLKLKNIENNQIINNEIQKFNEMNSRKAYHQQINQIFDDDLEQMQYGVVALPVERMNSFSENQEREQIEQVDGWYTDKIQGLTQGTKASKLSPIVQQDACWEQDYASLIKILQVEQNGIMIQHLDQVDFQEDKKRYVVTFQPQKNTEYTVDNVHIGLKNFIQQIKKVVE